MSGGNLMERLSLQQLRMNFLSRNFFQRSYYLLKKNQIKLAFRAIYILVFVGLFLEAGLIAYNGISFAHVAQEQRDIGIVDEATSQKVALIQRYESESRNVILIVNRLAGIVPDNIRFSKISIAATGDVLLDCVSNDANNFNSFSQRLKQETLLFAEVNLQNFSAAATGDKKTGVIKIKLR
jgi:hypothetical protein